MDRAPASVTIARLRLRGARADVDRARGPLLAALDRAPWPDPGPDAILFVRHLHLRGPAAELARHAIDLVRDLAAQAEDGWNQTAERADAVRFRSRTDLTACLLIDLLDGRAADRWFWARRPGLTQAPLADALVRVLEDAPLSLPELLSPDALQGVSHPRAATLWSRLLPHLDATATERLLAALRNVTGWPLRFSPAPPSSVAPIPASVPTALPAALRTHAAQLQTSFRRGANAPAVPLAAVLLAWRHLPATLATSDAAALLTHIARLVTHGDDAVPNASPGLKPVTKPPTTPSTARSPASSPATLATRNADLPDAPEVSSVAPSPFETALQPLPALPAASPAASLDDGVLTSCGGLFFLLNVLALKPAQALLTGRVAPGCGWRWLVRLAARLGLAPDAPLAAFLAAEAGLDDADGLAALPPLPEEDRLHTFALARYGDDLWRADAFRLSARILATPSHVDVYFRLADARLDLRRAGLDLNPGWLPWLGRVVSFHFDDGPLAPPSGYPADSAGPGTGLSEPRPPEDRP